MLICLSLGWCACPTELCFVLTASPFPALLSVSCLSTAFPQHRTLTSYTLWIWCIEGDNIKAMTDAIGVHISVAYPHKMGREKVTWHLITFSGTTWETPKVGSQSPGGSWRLVALHLPQSCISHLGTPIVSSPLPLHLQCLSSSIHIIHGQILAASLWASSARPSLHIICPNPLPSSEGPASLSRTVSLFVFLRPLNKTLCGFFVLFCFVVMMTKCNELSI